MSCGGPRFMATRPEVNRWRGNSSHWHHISLTLTLIAFEYAMRPLIHKLSLTKWKQMIHLQAPSSYRVDRLLYSCFKEGLLMFLRVVFLRHQTRFTLSRAVGIATHWLAERRARSHWMWLTSHDWVNEAMWQWRLMIRFIILHDRHFLAPWNSTSVECSDWSTFSWVIEGKRLINLIFIMWLSLLFYA